VSCKCVLSRHAARAAIAFAVTERKEKRKSDKHFYQFILHNRNFDSHREQARNFRVRATCRRYPTHITNEQRERDPHRSASNRAICDGAIALSIPLSPPARHDMEGGEGRANGEERPVQPFVTNHTATSFSDAAALDDPQGLEGCGPKGACTGVLTYLPTPFFPRQGDTARVT